MSQELCAYFCIIHLMGDSNASYTHEPREKFGMIFIM